MRNISLVAVVFALGMAVPAEAVSIAGIYNTGVDNSGNVLAVGTSDTHYVLNFGGDKGLGPFAYANSAYTTPGDASYISAQSGGGFRNSVNNYSLYFNLTGFDASTAIISGRFAADDLATIFLNGVSTGFTANGFASLTSFSISRGFVAGANILTFQVTDTAGPPSALFVDRTESNVLAAAVPEPASWAMMAGGFGLVGGALRRRAKQSRLATI